MLNLFQHPTCQVYAMQAPYLFVGSQSTNGGRDDLTLFFIHF